MIREIKPLQVGVRGVVYDGFSRIEKRKRIRMRIQKRKRLRFPRHGAHVVIYGSSSRKSFNVRANAGHAVLLQMTVKTA
jgi:hypothetical protein